MSTVVRFVAGALLIAHGLVHLLYLADDVEEFTIERSWIVPAGSRRPVATVLMAATVGGFALVGLAVWGVPPLAGVWPALVIAASITSLVLLVGYWSPRLVVGVAIDLALIAVAVVRPEWAPAVG